MLWPQFENRYQHSEYIVLTDCYCYTIKAWGNHNTTLQNKQNDRFLLINPISAVVFSLCMKGNGFFLCLAYCINTSVYVNSVYIRRREKDSFFYSPFLRSKQAVNQIALQIAVAQQQHRFISKHAFKHVHFQLHRF